MATSGQPPVRAFGRGKSVAGKLSISVDLGTFHLLQFGEEAIRYTHERTPHGAANQVTQIYRMRDGSTTNGEGVARLNRCIAAAIRLTGNPEVEAPRTLREIGIMAGLALATGTGTCEFLASLTFAYLASRVAIGTELELVEFPAILESASPNTGRVEYVPHCCVRISSHGRKTRVIADPWPPFAHACLPRHYFGAAGNERSALTAKYGKTFVGHPKVKEKLDQPWRVAISHTVTPGTVGRDLVFEAFADVGASALPTLFAKGLPTKEDFLYFCEKIGCCHRRYSVADELAPAVFYRNGAHEVTNSRPLLNALKFPGHFESVLQTERENRVNRRGMR
jgi:hypothetical protein